MEKSTPELTIPAVKDNRRAKGRDLLREHFSASVVALLTIISSVFYFAGSQYQDTMARVLGLAGDIGDGGLQKTMAVGANLIINSRLLPYLAAALVSAWIVISLLEFLTSTDRLQAKIAAYKSRLRNVRSEYRSFLEANDCNPPTKLRRMGLVLQPAYFTLRLCLMGLGAHILRYLVTARAFRGAVAVGLLAGAVIAFLAGILAAGQFEAERDAAAILSELRQDCSRCKLFTTQNGSATGIAVRQTSETILVAEPRGAVLLPITSGLRISAPPQTRAIGAGMAGFKSGVAVGAAVVGGLAIWLLLKIDGQPVSFPAKAVMADANYVSVIGSIIGDDAKEDDRPQNNMARMECWRSQMSCKFTTINETSPGHIGFPFTDELRVRQWNEQEMTADSLPGPEVPPGCNYYEIRVIFDTQDVVYTRIPNPKADKDSCKELFGNDNSIRQWRIGNGKASYDYTPGKS